MPVTTAQKAQSFTRKDSLREVKLDSGQVIGHVAEDHVTQAGTVPTQQSHVGDVIMATVATGDPNIAMATMPLATSSSSSTSPRNVPVKVLHLNPEQLKELNINLPNLENAEGPVQVYIIEENANVTGTSIISSTEQGVASAFPPPEGAGVVTEGPVEHYSLLSGVPFQKSEESGFYSMDLDDNGAGQVGLNVGTLDSGATEATGVNILESTNQIKAENSQSFAGIAHQSGLVHTEPERSSKEDGVPPNKRRKLNTNK